MLGRYEKLTIGYIMTGIKTSRFNWLDSSTKKHLQKSSKQYSVIEKLFSWIYNGFIIPILAGYFYITESGSHKTKVFYYRKPVWNTLRKLGLKSLIGNIYKPISTEVVKEKLMSDQCLAVSRIRLIPGQNKVSALVQSLKF